EVAPVHPDPVGERLLGHTLGLAELADPPAEQHLHVLGCHAVTVAGCELSLHGLYCHGLYLRGASPRSDYPGRSARIRTASPSGAPTPSSTRESSPCPSP